MRGLKKMESFAFCHKTFQEFFAALWLASKYENEKLKLCKCIKNVDDLFDYEMLITFLCGIDPMAGKQVWLDLAEHVQIPVGRVDDVQRLVCKFMKQQEFRPLDQATDQNYFCIANIHIHRYTSNKDVMLLRHVLEEYPCNVKSLRVTLFYYSSISFIPVLDLQKHNKLKELNLKNLYVEGLLLPVEGDRLTSLWLDHVTMNDQYLEQLSESLSSCSCLNFLYLDKVKCNEHSHSCCLTVLDLQKHDNLQELQLRYLSVKSLLLPVEGDRLTLLWLDNVTMNHQYLEQLAGSLSSCSCLEKLCFSVECSEHICCLPVLDLQKHNKLKELTLWILYVKGLLLPVERDRLISIELDNVRMNHQYLEQLSGSLSSCSCLEYLKLKVVKCNEQSHSCCLPVLDLQKHNKLEKLYLWNLSVKGLLLPVERDRFTSLILDNVTMNHQYLEQLSGSLSSCSCLNFLNLDEVKCSEQSHSCCLPVLDLQKHNKLEKLYLWNLSVKGLLLPVERDRFTSLILDNVTMNHQYLEQLSGSLSSCSCLNFLNLDEVKCSEQSHSCCLPVLDLQKHNKLEKLYLRYLSVKGLLLPVERDRFTSLLLANVTMNHQYLEQLSRSLSSCSCLEKLFLDKLKCNEQSHSCCLPVLDLQKHDELFILELCDLSVIGLLLPVEIDRFTYLRLNNVTMNHRGLEQLAGSLSSYSSKPSNCVLRMRCSEHSPTLCQPVIDMTK